jgi:hypothetical protein
MEVGDDQEAFARPRYNAIVGSRGSQSQVGGGNEGKRRLRRRVRPPRHLPSGYMTALGIMSDRCGAEDVTDGESDSLKRWLPASRIPSERSLVTEPPEGPLHRSVIRGLAVKGESCYRSDENIPLPEIPGHTWTVGINPRAWA